MRDRKGKALKNESTVFVNVAFAVAGFAGGLVTARQEVEKNKKTNSIIH